MGVKFICTAILVLTMTKTIRGACPKQLLDDLLSPANAERALQILRLAAVGANRLNSGGTTLIDDKPRILPALPAKQIVADFLPRRAPVAFPRPIGQPIIEVSPLPPPVIAPTVIQEKVYPAMPIPQPCPTPAMPVAYPPPPAPYPAAPVPLVNPFLPAASPVSALAPPTSSLLPPVVPTQVRSHFLRKIPIPPPCL